MGKGGIGRPLFGCFRRLCARGSACDANISTSTVDYKMRLVVTDVLLSVCLSVSAGPCKNGRTNQDSVLSSTVLQYFFTAYITCYLLPENSLSLIVSDLTTNCRAYLRRLTYSKTLLLLFVIP